MASFKIETSTTELEVVVGGHVEILFTVTNLADLPTDGTMTVEWVDGVGESKWADVVSGRDVRFSSGAQREVTVRIEIPAELSDAEIAKDYRLVLVVTGGIDQEKPDRSYPTPVRLTKADSWWTTPRIIGVAVGAALVVALLGVGIWYLLRDPGGPLFAPCAEASDCQKRYACSDGQCLSPVDGRCKDTKECVYPARCDGRCIAPKNPEKVLLGVDDSARVVVINETGNVIPQASRFCTVTEENKCIWLKQFEPVTKRFLLLKANKYLATDGDGNVVANRDARDPNTLWLIEPVEGEERKYTLQAADGRYLSLKGRVLRANADKPGETEEFTMPPVE